MRILALADEPDKRLWEQLDRRLLEGVELIISCGDLPAEYLSFITCFTHAPILYVHGNHDLRYLRKPPEGCVCIEDKLVNINGLRIMGLGGSVKYKDQTHFMYTEKQMRRRIHKLWLPMWLSDGVDILVTHAPARDVGDGDDFAHRGFSCFREFMHRHKPRVMLHGHQHMSYTHNFVREREFESTRVINASPKVFLDIEPAEEQQRGIKARSARRRFKIEFIN